MTGRSRCRVLPRTGMALALVTVGAMLLAGCSGGMKSLPLPFRTGTGDGSYQITVRMADLGNLVPNAEVKVDNITVGTVTGVAFENWTAKLTVSLDPSAVLPANAEARVGQKTLLGAQYLELAPPSSRPAVGTLSNGDVIPLTRTGRYPETEELLAALSMLLNQGGLSQVKTITSELNAALAGNEADARELIGNVGKLASTLDARKADIVRAIENMDRLSGTLAKQNKVIDNALRTVPPGLAALERQRTTLVRTLDSVSKFGDVATRVIETSRADLRANLQALQPVLDRLADSGKDLTESMGILPTFPFTANQAFPAVVNGDYGNLYITLDLGVHTLTKGLLRGFTLTDMPLLGGSSLAKGLDAAKPLIPGTAKPLPLPQLPPGAGSNPAPSDGAQAQQGGGLVDWLLGESSGGGN